MLAPDFGSQLDATFQLCIAVTRLMDKIINSRKHIWEVRSCGILRLARHSGSFEISDTRHSLKCERTPMPRRTVSRSILAPHSEACGPACWSNTLPVELFMELLTYIWATSVSQSHRSTILAVGPTTQGSTTGTCRAAEMMSKVTFAPQVFCIIARTLVLAEDETTAARQSSR